MGNVSLKDLEVLFQKRYEPCKHTEKSVAFHSNNHGNQEALLSPQVRTNWGEFLCVTKNQQTRKRQGGQEQT